MATILFTVKDFEQSPYTGSLKLVPRGVNVSGSVLISSRWIEKGNCEGFAFYDVVEGLYELTGSSPQVEDPFGLILVPTGSGTYEGGDLQVPPGTPTNIWVPASTLSSSWASSSLSSSWATYALTASHITASGVRGAFPTASYAYTASYALNAPGAIASGSSLNITASRALTASYALNATPTVSASWASASLSSSYARSGSVAVSASYAATAGNLPNGTYAITASSALSSSVAVSASYGLSSSFAVTASHGVRAITSSFALNASASATASLAQAITINGASNSGTYYPLFGVATTNPQNTAVYFDSDFNFTYNPGANSFQVSNISASTVTASILGNVAGTASVARTASYVSASNISGTVTSASYARSASYAPPVVSVPSASWASQSLSASWAPPFSLTTGSTYPLTSSFAVTASHAIALRTSASIQGATVFNSTLSGSIQLTEATAGLALYLDSQKTIRAGGATITELGYLSGVTSSIQSQIDGLQPRIGTGSFLPVTSSRSVSASFAPMGNTASGDFLITKAGNVVSLTLRGETMGGQDFTITSTPAGGVFSDNVFGQAFYGTFIGTASYAPTASYLNPNATASNMMLVWPSSSLRSNVWGGVELQDAISGNPLFFTEGGRMTFFEMGLDAGFPERVIVTDASSRFIPSEVTTTELDYLLGVTSSIQSQINGLQPRIGTGSLLPVTASRALTASVAVSSSHAISASYALNAGLAQTAISAGIASFANSSLSASYSLSSSYALSASFARSASYSVTSSYTYSSSYVVSSSFASGAYWAETASYAVTASYAETASFLNGFYYQPFSKVLPYTGSPAIIAQMVTHSFTTFTFDYTATSASIHQRGRVDAVFTSGQTTASYNEYAVLSNGNVNLTMSVTIGGNAVQLKAQAPQYWTFKGWTIFI